MGEGIERRRSNRLLGGLRDAVAELEQGVSDLADDVDALLGGTSATIVNVTTAGLNVGPVTLIEAPDGHTVKVFDWTIIPLGGDVLEATATVTGLKIIDQDGGWDAKLALASLLHGAWLKPNSDGVTTQTPVWAAGNATAIKLAIDGDGTVKDGSGEAPSGAYGLAVGLTYVFVPNP